MDYVLLFCGSTFTVGEAEPLPNMAANPESSGQTKPAVQFQYIILFIILECIYSFFIFVYYYVLIKI